jgi:hypothetical protein
MTYEDQPATFEELCKRAEATAGGFSRGYVTDAVVFARWILQDGRAIVVNLTSVQARCTELIEENRRLKAELEAKK